MTKARTVQINNAPNEQVTTIPVLNPSLGAGVVSGIGVGVSSAGAEASGVASVFATGKALFF